jgi:hypothetical protein
MADDWFYAQKQERNGPVPFAKLQSLAMAGWLTPEDLVWGPGMATWKPAREVEGLLGSALLAKLTQPLAHLGKSAPQDAPDDVRDIAPPRIPDNAPQPATAAKPKPARRKPCEIDLSGIRPRHVLAACGGFLAALGIAFTAIAQSRLALAFTLGGLFITCAGLSVEIGGLLGQAIDNISRVSREAAERRLRAYELATEKERLEVEAAKLAHEKHEQTARQAPPTPAPAPPVPSEALPGSLGGAGQVVVIHQTPVQRWSPGLAAVLSFFLPGLGQLYKGQIVNAICWFLFVGLGYMALIVPGLILHFCCVLGALSGNPWTDGKTMVVRE